MKDLQWFNDRIGNIVTRTFEYQGKKETSLLEVTEKNINYLWLLGQKGYMYTD